MNRPTPETDATKWTTARYGTNEYVEVVDADIARKLESERDEALGKLKVLHRLIEISQNVDDSKSETEIASSATFQEALALTNADLVEEENKQLRKELADARRALSPVVNYPQEDVFYKKHGEL